MVVEDSTLSVCGRGTPNAHSLGWGMGGVKSGSKLLRLDLPITIDKLYKTIYNSHIDKQFCLSIFVQRHSKEIQMSKFSKIHTAIIGTFKTAKVQADKLIAQQNKTLKSKNWLTHICWHAQQQRLNT